VPLCGSFDAVTNVVSIDYLAAPIQVLQETRRVLQPGGIAICSFSNRMFWTKAVKLWTAADEWQRVLICSAYFALAGFENIAAFKVGGGAGRDPLYVVQGNSPRETASSDRAQL